MTIRTIAFRLRRVIRRTALLTWIRMKPRPTRAPRDAAQSVRLLAAGGLR